MLYTFRRCPYAIRARIALAYANIRVEEREVDLKKLKTDLSFNDNDFLIGNIARLSVEKDQATLITAFALLLKKSNVDPSKLKLFLVGTGEDKDKLVALVESLGVSQKVNFLGVRNDILDLYSIMNLFVLSSRREGLPMVLLEAMAAQVPIIATDIDGVSTLIQNEKTGLLVKPQNPEELADAMFFLLQDQKKAEILAIQARKLVEEQYSSTIMAKQYKEIYQSLLN